MAKFASATRFYRLVDSRTYSPQTFMPEPLKVSHFSDLKGSEQVFCGGDGVAGGVEGEASLGRRDRTCKVVAYAGVHALYVGRRRADI